ncbi:hypothetical protein [Methanosarcina sp.]|uniref:hypothetical protein n=1 Tax=Methanosarcina sp. TaxID=2213 RepID=UPI002988F96E|nr:hypothetical protein [Methanosarcina sp.]MDW5548951.1 hypothetical protein [Methanosarcina sp.]MDW5552654.1 hypothetical protein [Methanosarcina sp.]MDW5559210.1 hypothetical protein [Methanosarcina sp.]
MSKTTNNILNLITSISLLLLVYSLFILKGIQPEGYTVDIYEQLPFHFYLTLLLCYISACVLLLAYRKMSAVLILFLVHTIVLITPHMLGYVSIGRGDAFSYLGLAGQGCKLSGFSNLSPTGPLFVSALAQISGLETSALSYFLPVFFSIIFITGMFLFYRLFMSREKLVLTAFLSSLIPYFGHFQTSAIPYYLCFCLIPLYLLVLRNAISDKNRAMAVCLLFMIPLIPLAHPFIFAYLACFSLFLAFSSKILKPGFLHKTLSLNSFLSNASHPAGRKMPMVVFLSITSIGFLICAKYILQFFNISSSNLILRAKTLVTVGFSTFPSTENGFFEFVHLLNLYYGKYYIPLIFILINSVIVWQNRKRFCHHFVRRYPRFLVLYIVTFFLELAFLLNPFISYPLDKFENLSFIIFAQIPLLGYSLYVIFLRKGYTLGLGSAVLVLCLLWTLGFFTCFSSPYTGGVSEAISENEAGGIQWLSGVSENYPYIMSCTDKDGIITQSGIISPAGLAKVSQNPLYASKNDSKEGIYVEKAAEKEPFYIVGTTFAEVARAQKSNETSVSKGEKNSLKAQAVCPAHKIYDSLNIEIYEHIP